METAAVKKRVILLFALMLVAVMLLSSCAHFSPQAMAKQFVNAVDKKDAAQLADCMYWDGSVESSVEKSEFVSHMQNRFDQEHYSRMQFVSYERGNQLDSEEAAQLAVQYNCKVREATHLNLKVEKIEDGVSQEEVLQLIAFKVGNLWYTTTDFTANIE